MSLNDDLEITLNKAAAIYDRMPPLLKAAASVFAIGSALDTLLSAQGSRIVERRLLDQMEVLREEMHSIDEKLVDHTYLGSEEFFDLIIKVFDSTTRTRHREKRRVYAKLIRGAVQFQNRTAYNPEHYLDVLMDLEILEIEVLTMLASDLRTRINSQHGSTPESKGQLSGYLVGSIQHKFQLPHEVAQYHVKRLEARGLVSEMTGGLGGGGHYETSKLVVDIVDYLSGRPETL